MKNLSAIILLFIANSISGVAQGISMIAIPWYFVREGLAEEFGLFYILTNILCFFWVPYCGTLIDRFNRKNILLVTTVISGIVLGSVTLFGFLSEGLPMFMVASIFTMTFLNYNIHYPNLYAFVQEISEKKWYGRIASFIEIQGQVTSVLAGAGAAMLLEGTQDGTINLFGLRIPIGFDIPPWEIYEIFAMDTLTYLVAFICILFMKFQPLKVREKELTSVLEQLKTGFRYLKNHAVVFLFGVASYSIFVATLLCHFYLTAIYVESHLGLGGDVYAASEMYYSLGAIIAGIGIQFIFRRVTIPTAIIMMTILTASLFIMVAFTKDEFLFYFMTIFLGLANAGTRVLRVTFLFSHLHNQVYGRVNSIFALTNISFRIFFLSIFALPFFHFENNITYAFLVVAFFLILTAGILIKNYGKMVALRPIDN